MPAFNHIRRGGSLCTPTERNRLNSINPYRFREVKMVVEVFGAISAFKETFELVKNIKEAADETARQAYYGQLFQKIAELQMKQSEIASLYHSEKERAMELTEKIKQYDMFVIKSADYEQHTTAAGSVVYRLKTVEGSDMPPHYLCTHCYHKSIISILQPLFSNKGYKDFICHNCESVYLIEKITMDYGKVLAKMPERLGSYNRRR